MSNALIQMGSSVTLHFSLKLENGDVVDSNFEGEPASLKLGDGNMLESFEQCLLGLSDGAEGSFTIESDQAFGAVNPENIHDLPRSRFANNMELSEGLVLSFADPAKAERPGVVTQIGDKTITVDFNHPLAGKSIVFEVKVLSVTDPDTAVLTVS